MNFSKGNLYFLVKTSAILKYIKTKKELGLDISLGGFASMTIWLHLDTIFLIFHKLNLWSDCSIDCYLRNRKIHFKNYRFYFKISILHNCESNSLDHVNTSLFGNSVLCKSKILKSCFGGLESKEDICILLLLM